MMPEWWDTNKVMQACLRGVAVGLILFAAIVVVSLALAV